MSAVLFGLGIFAAVVLVLWLWLYVVMTIEDTYPEGENDE